MRKWNFDNVETEKKIIAEVEKYGLTVCKTTSDPKFEIWCDDNMVAPLIEKLSLVQLSDVVDLIEYIKKDRWIVMNTEYKKGFDLAKRTVVSIKDTTHAKEVAKILLKGQYEQINHGILKQTDWNIGYIKGLESFLIESEDIKWIRKS